MLWSPLTSAVPVCGILERFFLCDVEEVLGIFFFKSLQGKLQIKVWLSFDNESSQMSKA